MKPKVVIHSIRKNIANADKSNSLVSNSSVGWHLDHSLKVIIGITSALKNSNPENYNPKFSLLKSFILFTGYIPRGKAKAPKSVVSNKGINVKSLEEQLEKAEQLLEEVKSLPPKSFYTHHMFGDLDLATTIKFIGIHTNHHIKIIKDII